MRMEGAQLFFNTQLHIYVHVYGKILIFFGYVGPPGTGKTYVGLKIMESILYNLYGVAGNEEELSEGLQNMQICMKSLNDREISIIIIKVFAKFINANMLQDIFNALHFKHHGSSS